jgi:hypothetical protein
MAVLEDNINSSPQAGGRSAKQAADGIHNHGGGTGNSMTELADLQDVLFDVVKEIIRQDREQVNVTVYGSRDQVLEQAAIAIRTMRDRT